jgi:hypothetical protein
MTSTSSNPSSESPPPPTRPPPFPSVRYITAQTSSSPRVPSETSLPRYPTRLNGPNGAPRSTASKRCTTTCPRRIKMAKCRGRRRAVFSSNAKPSSNDRSDCFGDIDRVLRVSSHLGERASLLRTRPVKVQPFSSHGIFAAR